MDQEHHFTVPPLHNPIKLHYLLTGITCLHGHVHVTNLCTVVIPEESRRQNQKTPLGTFSRVTMDLVSAFKIYTETHGDPQQMLTAHSWREKAAAEVLNFQPVPPKLISESHYPVVLAVVVNGDEVSSYGASGSETR